MTREKIGSVAFGLLLGLYVLDVLLPFIGLTWFARTEAHLFWIALLFLLLPIVTSLVGLVLIYGTQKLSWWLAPILIYVAAPVAFLVTVLLRSGVLVQVQEAAQNTQGFAAGALFSMALIFTTIAFPLFIGSPIVLAVCIWAEKDIKKVVAIPVISFVVLTIIFFLLLIDRA